MLCDTKKNTPLHLACRQKHTGIVTALLARDANPNARNDEQETPLHVATKAGALAIVSSLIDRVCLEYREYTDASHRDITESRLVGT